MEVIYLKIVIYPTDEEVELLREQGLFFDTISDALFIESDQVIEIDEVNRKVVIYEIEERFKDFK